MYRYFTFKNTWRYTDVLQHLVDSYNATHHRSIGMPPDEVCADNGNLFAGHSIRKKYSSGKPRCRYNVVDTVRIAMSRHSPFVKGYTDNWTRELFEIGSRLPTMPPTYALKDMSGESIKESSTNRSFRKSQRRDAHFDIDKILRRRGADGEFTYFVHWVCYPSKFNCWVDAVVPITR